MKIRRLIAGCISLFLAAVPCAVLAQSTSVPEHANRPQARGQSPGIAGLAVGGPVGVLTSQQLVSYENAMNGERNKLAELRTQLQAAHRDLLVTSLDQKFDENVIRQKALAAARIEAEMTVIRVKVFSQVQPPLTPEQIEKIKAGEPGPVHPLGRQPIERPSRREFPANTNQDVNGLPPKH